MSAVAVGERRFVLPQDVELWPADGADDVPGVRPDEVVVVRPGSRLRPKVVPRQAASLLEQFRTPATVAEAVLAHCAREGTDPLRTVAEAFSLLVVLSRADLLAVEGTAASRPTRVRGRRGDRCGTVTLTELVRALRDSEVWHGVTHDGRPAAVKDVSAGVLGRHLLDREVAALQRLQARAPGLAPSLLGFEPAAAVALDEADSHSGRLALTWADGVGPDVAAWGLAAGPDDPDGLARRRLALAVTEAYARLHEAGVLHGDVHPGNVLVADDGSVTLLDFGLARVLAGPFDGAPRAAGGEYVDPQAAEALLRGDPPDPVDEASEQYAVAALVWRVLTCGRYLDLDPDRDRALGQVVDNPPPSFLDRGCPAWPGGEVALRRALAKDPADRHASVRALASALAAALDEAPVRREPHRPTLADRVVAEHEVDGPRWRAADVAGGRRAAVRLARTAERLEDVEVADLARAWALR